jgi:hypothetical protein
VKYVDRDPIKQISGRTYDIEFILNVLRPRARTHTHTHTHIYIYIYLYIYIYMLQAGMSRVRFPIMPLTFFDLHNPSSRTVAVGFIQPLIKVSES